MAASVSFSIVLDHFSPDVAPKWNPGNTYPILSNPGPAKIASLFQHRGEPPPSGPRETSPSTMGCRWLITHRVIALVKFPIFPIGILSAHYFTETISQKVDLFDDVF